MNIEEAKKMVGTEFDYVLKSGDSVRSYIKKFDPKIGLTCLTLDTTTKGGCTPPSGPWMEEDGTWCVLGYHFGRPGHYMEEALQDLQQIRDTGKCLEDAPYLSTKQFGNAICRFK